MVTEFLLAKCDPRHSPPLMNRNILIQLVRDLYITHKQQHYGLMAKHAVSPAKCDLRHSPPFMKRDILIQLVKGTLLTNNILWTHGKACCLSWPDELNVTRHGILTDSTLHPHLPLLVAGLIDSHARLKVVHTAQHQVHRTTIARQVRGTASLGRRERGLCIVNPP